ncbi:late embryogenesis abundant protein (LEA) family protein [Artemisia annua]|uniref:Late embryogenesis abundant protein (LEA) family protein n=1 Tax=Artemisia annua TaxID=35608 RepID=A0A2U1PT23_ARTAN|nr:late embryogenesis abundant protein (LEA) family protein [Artemisia annua]
MHLLRINFARTSSCISFPRLVSRACFTSGSIHSQDNHASEETDNSYNADEAISYVPDESVELQRNTNENAREDDEAKQMKDKKVDMTSDEIKHMKYKAKENANDMKESTEDTTDVLKAAAEKTKDTAKDAWETTKDTTRKIKESIVGYSSFNVDDVWEDHTGKPKIKGDDETS